jgi:hypothetical protein
VPTGTPEAIYVIETATVTGGTGRFADATGSFTMVRYFNFFTEETNGTIEGTIFPPARAPAERRAAGEPRPRRRALTSPGVRPGRRGGLMSGCAFLRKTRTHGWWSRPTPAPSIILVELRRDPSPSPRDRRPIMAIMSFYVQ